MAESEVEALKQQVQELQAQLAVAKKVEEVGEAMQRLEGMAMQSASTTAKGQSETAESLARLEGMSMSSATNLAKFEKKLTDRTEGLEAMLMQAAMNTSKFEKKLDGRTEGMESMLLAGAHQNAKTISMLSSMTAAEEGTPGLDVVMGGGDFDLQAITRPNIWSLEAYHCARDDYTEGVLLDANENSFGPPVSPNELVYERYPCPYQQELKTLVAGYRGVDWTNVFVGVGSDEAIDMLVRIFCVPGKDSIIINPPTYGMYSVSAATNDVGVVKVPLTTDFEMDVDAILAAANSTTKIVFLCSPGNPACKLLSKDKIVEFLESDYKGIVVIDEAYIDFAPAPKTDSCCDLVATGKYPNLVVLQTMSKAFGLAGIRCGFAIGSPELIAVMSKVKAPYNVNKLTSKIAIEAFQAIDKVEENIGKVNAEKAKLIAALEALSPRIVKRILPSDSNFLMFAVDNAKAIYKIMADGGVVVRDRSTQLHCDGCLRVTVGTPEENAAFLEKLEETAARFFPKPLKAAVQQYAWGLSSEVSLVSSLGACNCFSFDTFLLGQKPVVREHCPPVGDQSKPFAELWMGTHPNGPALISDDDNKPLPLADYIKKHREVGGTSIAKASGSARTGGVDGGLPFLLKVLSVNTALSIQAHPDRTLAAKLHSDRPNVYKDPNHKPELICALEHFVGMCGFREANEISGFLTSVPELRALVGEEVAAAYLAAAPSDPSAALETLFGVLMRSEPGPVAAQLDALVARLKSEGKNAECTADADAMALYLVDQYPGDIGIWCVYFLNIAVLEPGQALYLGANLPHAYVKGQGVEIMAASDNVVRAGLTPKLRDVDTLCAMLDYHGEAADVLDGNVVNEHVKWYAGTADDFKLFRAVLPAGSSTELPVSAGPQIILGISGEAMTNGETEVAEGSVFFVPANQALKFEAAATGAGAQVFVACCNDTFFAA